MSPRNIERLPSGGDTPGENGGVVSGRANRVRRVFQRRRQPEPDLSREENAGTPDDESSSINYRFMDITDELQNNARALAEMQERGVQEYLSAIDAEEPILTEADDTEICVCCIDERQRNGRAHGSAGAGVLLDGAARERMAVSLVDQAEAMWEKNGGKTVTIRAKHHGKDKCGAAAKALADAGTPAKKPGDVDAKAAEGSTALADAVRSEVERRNLGGKIAVESSQYPEETFVQSHHHPGAAALVCTDPSLVYNQGRKKGPLMYNIGSLAGEDVAMGDAFLAALIATGGHGMEHGPAEIPLPAGLPFTIILAGTGENVARLRTKYEAELESNAAYKSLKGRLKIETWVRG